MLHSALPLQETLIRLGVATALGALVGLERERLDRAAGLRTHTLVAVASALLMLVSGYSFPDLGAGPRDPTRMAAQVVSGIGFLGAGVIIFRKNTVRGLTTAASIWAMAGVGLAAGGGMVAEACIGTGFILLVQAGLRPLERRFFVRQQDHRLLLRVARDAGRLVAVERAIAAGVAGLVAPSGTGALPGVIGLSAHEPRHPGRPVRVAAVRAARIRHRHPPSSVEAAATPRRGTPATRCGAPCGTRRSSRPVPASTSSGRTRAA